MCTAVNHTCEIRQKTVAYTILMLGDDVRLLLSLPSFNICAAFALKCTKHMHCNHFKYLISVIFQSRRKTHLMHMRHCCMHRDMFTGTQSLLQCAHIYEYTSVVRSHSHRIEIYNRHPHTFNNNNNNNDDDDNVNIKSIQHTYYILGSRYFYCLRWKFYMLQFWWFWLCHSYEHIVVHECERDYVYILDKIQCNTAFDGSDIHSMVSFSFFMSYSSILLPRERRRPFTTLSRTVFQSHWNLVQPNWLVDRTQS